MHNPTIHSLISQTHTDELHHAARVFRQQRTATRTGTETRPRTTPRSVSIRQDIQHLRPATTSQAATAPAHEQ